jgi:hypothetical protein
MRPKIVALVAAVALRAGALRPSLRSHPTFPRGRSRPRRRQTARERSAASAAQGRFLRTSVLPVVAPLLGRPATRQRYTRRFADVKGTWVWVRSSPRGSPHACSRRPAASAAFCHYRYSRTRGLTTPSTTCRARLCRSRARRPPRRALDGSEQKLLAGCKFGIGRGGTDGLSQPFPTLCGRLAVHR